MYKIPENTTGVDIPEDFGFKKEGFVLNATDKDLIDYVLLPEGLIKSRCEAMAYEIVQSMINQGVTELHLVVVMNGAFHFYSHLVQTLNLLVSQTSPRLFLVPQLIKVSSYAGTQQTGEMKMGQLDDVKGRHVLIIEDMIDTGNTIIKLRQKLFELGATKVEICIAFHKKTPRNINLDFWAEYIGFFIPDKFVIGYGLDYN